ncbi:MAG: type II/IV secretion system protein [Flavobacteriales bacterium]|nr:type II/IV secretion system protein [Flavobacteriales bacterium]MBK7484532.1 type II/IV secretion system protein [Flavobacteriales bacterium]
MLDEQLLELPVDLRNLITAEQAWHYRIIPKARTEGGIVFHAPSDAPTSLRNELEVVLGLGVELESLDGTVVDRALGTHYRRTGNASKRIDLSARTAEHVLQDLVHEARELGSSDVHLEVYDGHARVRIRIDGLLVERYRYATTDHPGLVNRVKVQAGLDISEKRLPQDGRMVLDRDGERTDIRVSILPTLHGEKVVLRLLGQDAGHLRIANLGMDDKQLADYEDGIKRPHGIVLISGPTGSGKTTTLYATLKQLNETRRNILTVEDPIEYTLEGINQVQLREHIGLTFAQALRTFLRQDPDVIMLGEIRDAETAQMAVRAALTGHLVLSTIHTNSAWGTVSRLMDMGVPPFLLAATVNSSVAQRLVRLLCTACARQEPWTADPTGRLALPGPLERHHVAVGCPECHFTGYKGRFAVYEVVAMDGGLQDLLRQGTTDASEHLAQKGIRTLGYSAYELLRAGRTSLDEVYPILAST